MRHKGIITIRLQCVSALFSLYGNFKFAYPLEGMAKYRVAYLTVYNHLSIEFIRNCLNLYDSLYL